MMAFWFTMNFGFAAINLGTFFLKEDGTYFNLIVGTLNFLASVHCLTKMREKVKTDES